MGSAIRRGRVFLQNPRSPEKSTSRLAATSRESSQSRFPRLSSRMLGVECIGRTSRPTVDRWLFAGLTHFSNRSPQMHRTSLKVSGMMYALFAFDQCLRPLDMHFQEVLT